MLSDELRIGTEYAENQPRIEKKKPGVQTFHAFQRLMAAFSSASSIAYVGHAGKM